MSLVRAVSESSPKTVTTGTVGAAVALIVYFFGLPTDIALAIVVLVTTIATAIAPVARKFVDKIHNENLSGD